MTDETGGSGASTHDAGAGTGVGQPGTPVRDAESAPRAGAGDGSDPGVGVAAGPDPGAAARSGTGPSAAGGPGPSAAGGPGPSAAAGRVDVEEHRADVAALLADLTMGADGRPRTERVAVGDALGRVLAGPVPAPVDLPLFRNSQMDGFAVRSADIATAAPARPAVLPVVAEIPAGPGVPRPLAPGTAARIMTGAPVPEGADAVVPVEDTEAGEFPRGARPGTETVAVLVPRVAGEFVRDVGSDVRAGAVVAEAGTVVGPHHVAALAACGIVDVEVRALPRVAVLSTGSELAAPGTTPEPGQVFDANLLALTAAVRAAGGVVTFAARAGDDVGQFGAALAEATRSADLVLTSGGVSRGAYEVVKDVLAESGSVTFRSVAMQPGGPQGFGRVHGVPILTFPGNPVSAQVSFVVFARVPLARAAGFGASRPARGSGPGGTLAGGVGPGGGELTAVLDGAVVSPRGKRQFLRGALVDGGDRPVVRVVGGPGSHLVASMARADVLVDVPADVERWEPGTEVRVWSL